MGRKSISGIEGPGGVPPARDLTSGSAVAGRVVGRVGDALVAAATALGVVGAEVAAQPVGSRARRS